MAYLVIKEISKTKTKKRSKLKIKREIEPGNFKEAKKPVIKNRSQTIARIERFKPKTGQNLYKPKLKL